jgi:hypothetical protein
MGKTRQDDKMYQRHIDFLPMDGQSPQSRQLIENQGLKNRFFSRQSRQHTENTPTYNDLPKAENRGAQCPK